MQRNNDLEYLRSQIVTANISSTPRSKPYVFTEQGVYMLMSRDNAMILVCMIAKYNLLGV